MQTFGDKLLAGAPLSDNEHGPVEGGGAARALNRIEEGQALADELVGPLHVPTVGGKSHHLARIFTAVSEVEVRILHKSGLFAILARLLNGKMQV
jgi:hypothetical protein